VPAVHKAGDIRLLKTKPAGGLHLVQAQLLDPEVYEAYKLRLNGKIATQTICTALGHV
jgi:hypothetical protein